MNRGRFIIIAFYIPLAIIAAFFVEDALLAMGQDSEVARLTQIQVWYNLPSFLFWAQFDLYKRWLLCIRNTFVPMVAMIVITLLHLPLCLIFVEVF